MAGAIALATMLAAPHRPIACPSFFGGARSAARVTMPLKTKAYETPCTTRSAKIGHDTSCTQANAHPLRPLINAP